MTLPRHAVLRVRARITRGSSSPVLADTGAGTFVVKLRGAAQGVPPLIAEVVVAELGFALGLSVPECTPLELPRGVPSDDANDELRDLLIRSEGLCLGVRYLPGARDLRPLEIQRIPASLAARVLWLDGLVMNLDRTPKNPNILFWNGQPWLIDHGAALTFHYDLAALSEDAARERFDLSGHVLAGLATSASVDEELAAVLTREVLERALSRVPDDWLFEAFPGEPRDRMRELYVAFLRKRLRAPRPFVDQR
jgi:hypothetical protein